MEDKLFEIASKIARPISLASLTVIALYLVYRAIVGLNIFSPLEESNTFNLLRFLADRVFYLALISLLLGIASYLYIQRLKMKSHESSRTIAITGNIFFDNGYPAEGATVFVEGIDRRRNTDSNGWFKIEVNEQKSYTIRAYFGDINVSKTIKRDKINDPTRLTFPKAQPRMEGPGNSR